MKRTRKVTRVKLQIDQINDFILLGIVSAEPDYKLSLALNRKFGISLKSISPIKIAEDPVKELLFSRFSDSSESPERIFNLISNRSGKHFFIKKLRNIDYLFHLHDPENESDVTRFINGLREITAITAVFTIDAESIKDKHFHLIIQ